jgi:poly-gamma-glutamate capsule biosynthesis protein CapA/YwtB (metallophosphatase superfamily)
VNAGTPGGPLVRVTFLGDTLIGGEAQATLDEFGPAYALDGIRHLLDGSDLVVVNHEGPITRRDLPDFKVDTGRKRYWYRAQPESIQALLDVGVRVVSLANNHVLDYGPDALSDTTQALDTAGIARCGAGTTRAEARRPAIVTANGLRFGFLSFMQRYDLYVAERLYATKVKPGPLRLSLDRARVDLDRMKSEVDVCVALVHWGRNYRPRNPRQRRLATELCAAGADLIVGHHPHVPQPIEIVDGVPVCYSLGNGPLGTPGRFHSGRPPYGLVVSIDYDARGHIRAMQTQIILVDNARTRFQPCVADDAEAIRLLRSLLPAELDWRPHNGGGFECQLNERHPAERHVDRAQP